MSIRIGERAPELEIEAFVRGEPDPVSFSLSDFPGKWIVLFFYPRDFTFVCPTEIQAFAALFREFEQANAVILGASTRHTTVTDLNVGRNVEETLRVLQALQTGELCPAGWRPGHATLSARPVLAAAS